MVLLIDGTNTTLSEGALYALLSIVMVFAVLLIIIGITSLIFKLMGLFELKAELDAQKTHDVRTIEAPKTPEKPVIEDEDMMAAVLVATIDYRNQIGKNVRLVSVRKVK